MDKAIAKRSKQAAKEAKNLAGRSLYADLEEMKSLCQKYREGIKALSADDTLEIMKKVYLHLKTGRLDKDTTASLYDILERLYLRKDVLARISQSNDPVIARGLRPFMQDVIAASAKEARVQPADYIQLARRKPDMLKLEDDQIVRMARIIGKGEADPIAVINARFGAGLITRQEHAALMLELNSKNIVPRSAVVQAYNNLARDARTFLRASFQSNDPACVRVLQEIDKGLASGAVASADETIVGIFKNEALREDLRRALGPGSNALLTELSKANTIKEMETALSGIGTAFTAPSTASDLVTLLGAMGQHHDLVATLEARRVLDQSTTEIANAIRAASLGRAKFARGILPAIGENVEAGARGAYRLGKFGASPVAVPSGMALDEFAEARVSGVRARRIARGAIFTILAAGGLALSYQAIKYFTWGKTAREREAAREILAKTWNVGIKIETANKMKGSQVAEDFFTNKLLYSNSSKLADDLSPKNEAQLNALLKRPGLFIHPANINELAAEVDGLIKTMRQQGKSDDEIKEALDDRVTGDWRKKGYFLTPGELFMERFGKELNLTRDMINYLKATVLGANHTELFTLLWVGIRDGSLPRTFAADVASQIYAAISDETGSASAGKTNGQLTLEAIQGQLAKRKTLNYETLPSVRDSLAEAGITSIYLLKTPIPAGSLMDFYDQYATSRDDEKIKAGFQAMLVQYASDPEAAKRLNDFRLGPEEAIYGNVPTIVRRVAEGTLSLDKARAQHTVADEIFARLTPLDESKPGFDRGLIEFVYLNSDAKGNGMLKWLKDHKQHIKNGPELVKEFQRNRSMFIGKVSEGKDSVYEICNTLVSNLQKSYVAEEEARAKWYNEAWSAGNTMVGFKPAPLHERWYVQTTEPFMSWTARDVMPREAGIPAKATPVVTAESEALLRQAIGEALYPGRNETQWKPKEKQVRDAVFKSTVDKALANDDANNQALASAGITVKRGPAGLVIETPRPAAKAESAAFGKFVTDTANQESSVMAVEAALSRSVAAALTAENKQYAAKVTRNLAVMIAQEGIERKNALSERGIKVTQAKKGGRIAVKVPALTEDFREFINNTADRLKQGGK